MKIKSSDVLILGGGLTGLCMASVLSNLDLQMVLIDQYKITSKHHAKKDLRTVAISYGTKLFLEKHGIWDDLKKDVQPIETIKVLNRNINSKILRSNSQQLYKIKRIDGNRRLHCECSFGPNL